MATPFDPTSDADFAPPRERAFHELIADIRTRVFAGVNDSGMLKDLRLFIICRTILNHTEPEIADEMENWGIPETDAIPLIRAVAGSGSSDVEGRNVSAASVRTDPQYQRAVRMVADQPRRVRGDLNFGPSMRPSQAAALGQGRRIVVLIIAVIIALVVALPAVVGLFILIAAGIARVMSAVE